MRVHGVRGTSSFNKTREHPSKTETNFVFTVNIMKVKFRKVEYIAEDHMVDEWSGRTQT